MRVLVLGCGYVGLPLAARLAREGHEVLGVRRQGNDQELIDLGIQPVRADITRPETLREITGPFDWVINAVSSTQGGVDEYRAVYLEGTRHLIDWLAGHPPKRFVFTGSTSVYGQSDGSWVTEDSPTEPGAETSRVLVETEELLRQSVSRRGLPAVILRLAGIYGPGRGHPFRQYVRGEAQMTGDGSRTINMIHRDDVVTAIGLALERGKPGGIYNVADDEPVTQREFFTWVSGQLGGAMPPAGEAEKAGRKRGLTNKRVANRKLRLELGCELKYPTFRQGYAAEIARLRAEGKLAGRQPAG